MRTLILTILFAIYACTSTVTAALPADYLSEFNNTGETCSGADSWNYLDNSSSERYVVNFQCCSASKSNCISLPFDVANSLTLNSNSLTDISKVILLHEAVRNEIVKTSNFDFSSAKDSVLCDVYGIDVFRNQSKNAAIKVAAEDVAPKIFSKRNAKLIKDAYEIAKTARLVADVEPIELGVSAVCTGSDYFEDITVSSLATCKLHIDSIEEGYATYGMADKFTNCQAEAKSKLKYTQYAPGVLSQYVEQRLFEGGSCAWDKGIFETIKSGFAKCEFDETKRDEYTNKINELNSIQLPNLQVDATRMASLASKRFEDKQTAANKSLVDLNLSIANLEAANFDHFWNIVKNYTVNTTSYYQALNDSRAKQANAAELMRQNKFNSAILAAQQGIKIASEATTAAKTEAGRPWTLRTEFIVTLTLTLVLLIAFIMFRKRRSRHKF